MITFLVGFLGGIFGGAAGYGLTKFFWSKTAAERYRRKVYKYRMHELDKLIKDHMKF